MSIDVERAASLHDYMLECMAGRKYDFEKHGPLRLVKTRPFTVGEVDATYMTRCADDIYTFELRHGTYFVDGVDRKAGRLECEGLIVDAWYVDHDGRNVPLVNEVGKPAVK